jgi:hypothetical protein
MSPHARRVLVAEVEILAVTTGPDGEPRYRVRLPLDLRDEDFCSDASGERLAAAVKRAARCLHGTPGGPAVCARCREA